MRVGIDLVSVGEVAEALAVHGDRYLTRVYTPGEVADCTAATGVDPTRLAARFAAKEAARKALGESDGMAWSAVSVSRDASGAPRLALTGRAAEVAAAAGLTDFALSLTHEAGLAAAVVVAS